MFPFRYILQVHCLPYFPLSLAVWNGWMMGESVRGRAQYQNREIASVTVRWWPKAMLAKTNHGKFTDHKMSSRQKDYKAVKSVETRNINPQSQLSCLSLASLM